MKKIFQLILLFLISSILLNSYGQEDFIKHGCKYTKSKIKMSGFTQEELNYSKALEFRSDTFDIINYRIKLDVTNFGSKVLVGKCDIDFSPKLTNLNEITFDLLQMNVDSVKFNNNDINFNYTSPFLKIKFNNSLNLDDTLQVSVYYHGISVIDPSGFGGFQFEKGYAYNLGIGLTSIPHNYGRSWFPCFDNFVERSTYDLDILTQSQHKAYCVGVKKGVDTLLNGKKIFHFRMDKQIPTYLVGVAVSDYSEINWEFEGLNRNIPIQLVGNPKDTTNMKTSFAYLPFAVEALEKWFGPYQWSRVGYVLTSHGAMEHPTNVAFPDFLGNNGNPEFGMSTMSHELAHHWWGDITTLTTALDMWIKEGTSEYGHHLFIEHFFGDNRFKDVIKANQFEVISTAHIKDDGYRALSGMPLDHTYGTTTYNKGAAVIHNLRTYMGDSLFKVGMRSILEEYKYSHIDAPQFEAQLEKSTGLDLTCFFNDWIKAPGFNAFEIDSIHFTPKNNEFEAEIFIEQKLHHAPHFHCDVPVEITFYDDEYKTITKSIIVSDQFSNHNIKIPFRPIFWTINENQKLNNGQIGENIILKPNTKYKLDNQLLTINTNELSIDSIFTRVEHVWGAPDHSTNLLNDYTLRVSSTHYWNIIGNLPDNNINVSFTYKGGNDKQLDFDLTSENEDSIVLIYRANSKDNWDIVENVKKKKLLPNDGIGQFKLIGLENGQYTFANLNRIALNTTDLDNSISIYPNPSDYMITFLLKSLQSDKKKDLYIFSINGDNIYTQKNVIGNEIKVDTKLFNTGIYFVKIIEENNNTTVSKFEIHHRKNKE